MTCVVVALVGNRAHIFADTAHIGPTGKLVSAASKIATLPKSQIALAVRGSVAHVKLLRWIVRFVGDFESAKRRLPSVLNVGVKYLIRVFGHVEIYIVGIGRDGRPAAFVIVTHRLHDGVEPLSVVDITRAVATGPAPNVAPEPSPVRFGIEAAELQRGVMQKLPFYRKRVSIVGGALEHVIIGPQGFSRRFVGGWYDRLGERLNPRAKFSASGSSVRRAARLSMLAWFMPTGLFGFARLCVLIYVATVAVRIAWILPNAVYVERTYHNATQTTVDTPAGGWNAWTRLDLGKLITSPTPGRASADAAIGRLSMAANHTEAAKAVLAAMASPCTVETSREVLINEYEHDLKCR